MGDDVCVEAGDEVGGRMVPKWFRGRARKRRGEVYKLYCTGEKK